MSALVAYQRIDEHRAHFGDSETSREGQIHHCASVPHAQIALFTDPDINRAQALRNLTPIMTLFAGGVDNLDKADGTAIDLRYQLLAPVRGLIQLDLPNPFFARVRRDYVGLFIPALQ
jgi:hypothetical protein